MQQQTTLMENESSETKELARKMALWEEKGLLDKMMADIDEALESQ